MPIPIGLDVEMIPDGEKGSIRDGCKRHFNAAQHLPLPEMWPSGDDVLEQEFIHGLEPFLIDCGD